MVIGGILFSKREKLQAAWVDCDNLNDYLEAGRRQNYLEGRRRIHVMSRHMHSVRSWLNYRKHLGIVNRELRLSWTQVILNREICAREVVHRKTIVVELWTSGLRSGQTFTGRKSLQTLARHFYLGRK